MLPTERARRGDRLQRAARTAYVAHVRLYVAVNTLCVLIWLIAGAGAFWPIWVIVPWGFALALQSMATFTRSHNDS